MNPERTEEEKLAEFEERVARGEKVEPGDWMPEDYRKTFIWIGFPTIHWIYLGSERTIVHMLPRRSSTVHPTWASAENG